MACESKREPPAESLELSELALRLLDLESAIATLRESGWVVAFYQVVVDEDEKPEARIRLRYDPVDFSKEII